MFASSFQLLARALLLRYFDARRPMLPRMLAGLAILLSTLGIGFNSHTYFKFKMANMSMDDSAYASISLEDSIGNIEEGISVDHDSAFLQINLEDFDFENDDEILPNEDEFRAQVSQNCLTSTDESEDLLLRLEKINTQITNKIVRD